MFRSVISTCAIAIVFFMSSNGFATVIRAEDRDFDRDQYLEESFKAAEKRYLESRSHVVLPQQDQNIPEQSFLTKTTGQIRSQYFSLKESISSFYAKLVEKYHVYKRETSRIIAKVTGKQEKLAPPNGSAIYWENYSSGGRPETLLATDIPYTDDGYVTEIYWEFGDGTSILAKPSELDAYATILHYYPGPGSYKAKLRLYDDSGVYSEYTSTVNIVNNQLPIPKVSVSTNFGGTPLSVTFTATGSDPENNMRQYAWRFGDGSADVKGAAITTTTKTYTTTGTYTARLRMKDMPNGVNLTTFKIYVGTTGNSQPSVIFDSSDLIGPAPHTVNFTAANSFDVDGAIVSYEWNFGDFGAPNNIATGATPSFTYQQPGTYMGNVKVTDSSGNSSTKYFNVFVEAVNFDAIPKIFAFKYGNNRTVNFDANRPWMKPLVKSQFYQWDFGDGTTGAGQFQNRTYAADGTYTVKLTSLDVLGRRFVVQRNITVGNTVDFPIAGMWLSQNRARVGDVITFHGEGSVDPQSQPIDYAWYFGDGSKITGPESTTETVTHGYSYPGIVNVDMIVTNSRGFSNYLTTELPIIKSTDVNSTIGRIRYSPKSGVGPLTVNFDADLSFSNGHTITGYYWDIAGQKYATGSSTSHTFTNPGEYYVKLYAKDSAGNGLLDVKKVRVVNSGSIPGGNQAPTGEIAIAFSGGSPNSFIFTAENVVDPDSDAIEFLEWGVDGVMNYDGSPVYWGGLSVGRHIVTLKMIDIWGASTTVSKQFDVATHQNPQVLFDHSPEVGVVASPVYFLIEKGIVPGTIVDHFEWDFGDGGTGTSDEVGDQAQHTYASAGTYTVKLKVVGENGVHQTYQKDIVVEAAVSPTAVITARDLPGSQRMFGVEEYSTSKFPEAVQFGLGDSITQVTLTDATWDFGDGNTGFGMQPIHTYHKPGTYEVDVTIYDSKGASSSKSIEVTVPSDYCPDQDGMAVCLELANSNGNVLPLSLSTWIIKHSLGAVDYSTDPADYSAGWIRLRAADDPADTANVNLDTCTTINGDQLELSKICVLGLITDLKKAYRLEVDAVSDTGDNLSGVWPRLFFGQGNLSVSVNEADVRLIIRNETVGFDKYVKLNSGTSISISDLPLGYYTVIAEKDARTDSQNTILEDATTANVSMDLSAKALERRHLEKLKNAELMKKRLLRAQEKGEDLFKNPINSRYCNGQYPYQIVVPEAPMPEGYYKGYVFWGADPMVQSEFKEIPATIAQPLVLKCTLQSFSQMYSMQYWDLVLGPPSCDPPQPISPNWYVYLDEVALYDTQPMRILVEVRDPISKESKRKTIVKSAAGLRSEMGISLESISHTLGAMGGNNGRYTFEEEIEIPSTWKRPEMRFEMETVYMPGRHIPACYLMQKTDQTSLSVISLKGGPFRPSSKKLLNDATMNQNGKNSRSGVDGFFPLQADNTSTGPASGSKGDSVFVARYHIDMGFAGEGVPSCEKFDLTFKYNNNEKVVSNGEFEETVYKEKEKKLYGTFLVDARSLGTHYSWVSGVTSPVEMKITPKDCTSGLTIKKGTFTFKPLFDLKQVNAALGSNKPCPNDFYSTSISAYATNNLISFMRDMSADGVGFRCNDASLPFGGPFDLGGSWNHKGHAVGKEIDVRYFNTDSIAQDDFDGGDALNRRLALGEYMTFSDEAKNIAESSTSPYPAKKLAILNHCLAGPSGVPCGSGTVITDLTHEKIAKICQLSLVSIPDCPYLPLSSIVKYSTWAQENMTALRKIVASGQTKEIIVSHGAAFSWQYDALVLGKWPDGLPILKMQSGAIADQQITCNGTIGCDNLTNKLTDVKNHFHHIHLGVK